MLIQRIARNRGQLEKSAADIANLSLNAADKLLRTRKRLPTSSIESTHPVQSPIEIQHAQTQWVLAKLGQKLCGRVWIARDDRSEIWENDKLGDFSVDVLPPLGGIGNPTAQQIVQYIDVLWLSGDNYIVSAFEVERTTSIYSGLLRMADLIALCPNLNINLYLIVPEARVEEVKKQLLRPAFKALKLHQKCRWIVIEELVQEYALMKYEYATETNAINKLAYTLGN